MTAIRRVSIALILAAAAATLAAEQAPAANAQARELYRLLGGDKLTLQTLQAVLSMAGRDPKVAPYEGIIRTWLESSMASSHFEDDMARYYASTFTDKELKDIIAFLHTPTGQKVITQMPGLIQHGANLSAVVMEQNRTALEEALGKRKSTSGKTKR